MQITEKIRQIFFSAAFWKAVVLILLLVGLWLVARRMDFSMEAMRNLVVRYGPTASMAVFIGAYVFTTLAPISARDVMKILGLALFGPFLSAICLWIADIISAVISFYLAKWLGRDFVEKITGKRMAWINKRLEENGVRNMIILRVLPTPYRHLNFLSGVTRISFHDFFLGTLIGALVRALYGQFILWPFLELILKDETKGSHLVWIAMGGLAVMMVTLYGSYLLLRKLWPSFFSMEDMDKVEK